MRIGVVSDTHGHADFARAAARMLESLEVEAVLHAGDIGTPEIVTLFAAWPAHFVFGNTDYDQRLLRTAIEQAGQTCHGLFGDIALGGRRIALLHGDDGRALDSATHSGDYDLLCHGHTHVAHQEQVGRTLVLNPGALFRAHPHSIAIVELDTLTATHIVVE